MLEPLDISFLIAVLFLAVLGVISYLVFTWKPETDSQKEHQEIEELQQECLRLQQELAAKSNGSDLQDFRVETFQELQNLLVNYPTVCKMAEVKPNLPAKYLTVLFKSLDQLLSNWNYQTIGQPWQEVEYDPKLHQSDSEEIEPGDKVYIRFVGYRDGENILYPAKVSRDLPGGIKG